MNREQWWAVVSLMEDIKALIERQRGLDEVRVAIRGKLAQIRRHLGATLPEAEVFKLLFPLVIYCDELMLRHLADQEPTRWPLLQAELYQIRDGGEALYRLLDDELEKPEMSAALAEVLYYCLNDGFVGRLSGEPLKIKEYQERLAGRIQARAKKLGGALGDGAAVGASAADGKRRRGRASRAARAKAAAAPNETANATENATNNEKSGPHKNDAAREDDRAREETPRRRRKRQPQRSPLPYYIGAAVLVVAAPLLLLWFSNL